MTYFLHQNDIPSDLKFGNIIAIDTETMGLNLQRDRLCLVQLSSGDGNAHLVQISKESLEKKESFFMLHAVPANLCVVFLKGAPNPNCRLSSTTVWVLDVVYFQVRYVSIYVTGRQATFV